jgi:hypothetical protein
MEGTATSTPGVDLGVDSIGLTPGAAELERRHDLYAELVLLDVGLTLTA